jgi:hypothetical protein
MLGCMKKTHLILTLALAIAANLLLLAPLPHELRAAMVLLVAGFLPGWLLVEALTGRSASPPDRWMLAGALVLLVTASLVRFVNLGYADFQGDEARAALRAAAVLQGYEDVLMLHKKGPTEILIPTALYTLTGHLTEAPRGCPLPLPTWRASPPGAGLAALRPLAGWLAAMFLRSTATSSALPASCSTRASSS